MSSSLVAFAVLLSAALVLTGCAQRASTQWWRVGSCLVLYDQSAAERHDHQIIVVGQGCDIKRDTLTAEGAVKP
ncbi:MAG: hypothetical protein ACREJG_11305 [Candidatus Rokuibacteriota bacterium]